jgi:hypothetical protein
MNNVEQNETLFAVLEENNEEVLKMFGLTDIDYSIESLEMVEMLINAFFPEGHEPLPTTILPFGYYLGEVIRRNTALSNWEIEEDCDVWDIKLKLQMPGADNKAEIKPFLRAYRFFLDRSDGLAAMARMIQMMSIFDTDSLEEAIEEADEDGWIHLPNGDSFRIHQLNQQDEEYDEIKKNW